jgi:hypothetical protein
LEEYNSHQPYFDNIGRVQYLVDKTFQHEDAIEDHWMNIVDDYDIRIRDYCRMTLYLERSSFKIKVPLKVVQQDTKDVLDPLHNIDKICDRPIMNVEIDKEENLDINHRAKHVIKLTKDWIKRPFKQDPIPQEVFFHAIAHPTKGRGAKVTMPTFTTQSLVRPEIMHQLDREVRYYRAQKGKGKRKITSPKQDEPKEGTTQALPQQGA